MGRKRRKDPFELEWLKAGSGTRTTFKWKAPNFKQTADNEGLARFIHMTRGIKIDMNELPWLQKLDKDFILGDVLGKRKRKGR